LTADVLVVVIVAFDADVFSAAFVMVLVAVVLTGSEGVGNFELFPRPSSEGETLIEALIEAQVELVEFLVARGERRGVGARARTLEGAELSGESIALILETNPVGRRSHGMSGLTPRDAISEWKSLRRALSVASSPSPRSLVSGPNSTMPTTATLDMFGILDVLDVLGAMGGTNEQPSCESAYSCEELEWFEWL